MHRPDFELKFTLNLLLQNDLRIAPWVCLYGTGRHGSPTHVKKQIQTTGVCTNGYR